MTFVVVKKPKHPLGQMATFGLRDYRAALERALAEFPERGRPADREALEQRLAEVISVQEAHARAIGLPAAALVRAPSVPLTKRG